MNGTIPIKTTYKAGPDELRAAVTYLVLHTPPDMSRDEYGFRKEMITLKHVKQQLTSMYHGHGWRFADLDNATLGMREPDERELQRIERVLAAITAELSESLAS
jgi:hypothetical protein